MGASRALTSRLLRHSAHFGDRCEGTFVGLRSDSVGNASVTCRFAENHVEGLLTDPVNSHYVP